MSAGPLTSDQELRRELSPCSLGEIDSVAEELFDQSCLLSRGQVEDNNNIAGTGTSLEILNRNCETGKKILCLSSVIFISFQAEYLTLLLATSQI